MIVSYRPGQLILLGRDSSSDEEVFAYHMSYRDGHRRVPHRTIAMYLGLRKSYANVHEILLDEVVMLVNGASILGPVEE